MPILSECTEGVEEEVDLIQSSLLAQITDVLQHGSSEALSGRKTCDVDSMERYKDIDAQ